MHRPYSSRSVNDPYFRDRLGEPYRSTVHLYNNASERGVFRGLGPKDYVLDAGCGTGSESAYLAERIGPTRLLGIDVEPHFIEAAESRYGTVDNLSFAVHDLINSKQLPQWQDVKVIWLSQVLSWLPIWWEEVLNSLIDGRIQSVVISTLAWPGQIESQVVHRLPGDRSHHAVSVPYNVYSIDRIANFMTVRGFSRQQIVAFEIDVDLPEIDRTQLGSYTRTLEGGHRMTFSLWQHLPWVHFVFQR